MSAVCYITWNPSIGQTPVKGLTAFKLFTFRFNLWLSFLLSWINQLRVFLFPAWLTPTVCYFTTDGYMRRKHQLNLSSLKITLKQLDVQGSFTFLLWLVSFYTSRLLLTSWNAFSLCPNWRNSVSALRSASYTEMVLASTAVLRCPWVAIDFIINTAG